MFPRVDDAFLREQNVLLACIKTKSAENTLETKVSVTIVIFFYKWWRPPNISYGHQISTCFDLSSTPLVPTGCARLSNYIKNRNLTLFFLPGSMPSLVFPRDNIFFKTTYRRWSNSADRTFSARSDTKSVSQKKWLLNEFGSALSEIVLPEEKPTSYSRPCSQNGQAIA